MPATGEGPDGSCSTLTPTCPRLWKSPRSSVRVLDLLGQEMAKDDELEVLRSPLWGLQGVSTSR